MFPYLFPLASPSLPPSLSHPSGGHKADLPVLHNCFPLTIEFTFDSVYTSMPLSQFIPAYPSPSLWSQVHSLRLHLYSCPAPTFFRTFFSFF